MGATPYLVSLTTFGPRKFLRTPDDDITTPLPEDYYEEPRLATGAPLRQKLRDLGLHVAHSVEVDEDDLS